MKPPKLKKCPFCGKVPVPFKLDTVFDNMPWNVNCGCRKRWYSTKSAAIKAWNRRKG